MYRRTGRIDRAQQEFGGYKIENRVPLWPYLAREAAGVAVPSFPSAPLPLSLRRTTPVVTPASVGPPPRPRASLSSQL